MPTTPLPAPPAPPAAAPGGALAALHRGTTAIGRSAHASLDDTRTTLAFIGELLQATGRVLAGTWRGLLHRRGERTRSHLRGIDLLAQLDQSGPRSLPIVSLVSGLVGVILAYMGAVQLQ